MRKSLLIPDKHNISCIHLRVRISLVTLKLGAWRSQSFVSPFFPFPLFFFFSSFLLKLIMSSISAGNENRSTFFGYRGTDWRSITEPCGMYRFRSPAVSPWHDVKSVFADLVQKPRSNLVKLSSPDTPSPRRGTILRGNSRFYWNSYARARHNVSRTRKPISTPVHA